MEFKFKVLGKEAIAYEFQIGGQRLVGTNLDTATEIVVNNAIGRILPYCSLDEFTHQLALAASREPSLRIEVVPTATFFDEWVINSSLDDIFYG